MGRYPNIFDIYGLLKYSEMIDVGNGVMFIGHGPVGNDTRGPMIEFEEDGFLFNGSQDVYNGTGGGIVNLKLFKKLGVPGNTAIKLTATSRERRCGETLLERLLIYGSGNSQGKRGIWANGIHVDGTMLTTPGQAGIRATTIRDVRISDCVNYGVLLENAVNCKIDGLQIDPGQLSSIKMKINGGQNIVGSNIIINGDLIIENTSYVSLTNLICYGNIIINKCKNIFINGILNTIEFMDSKCVLTGLYKNITLDSYTKLSLYGQRI